MSHPRWLRWTDWSLGAKSAAALALPLTLLLVATLFSYRVQQQITAAEADVRRALAIQADIQVLHSLIAESATSVRGYLLTGQDDFLAPYRLARQSLPRSLSNLRSNIRDAEMTGRLQRIERLLDRKLESLEQLRREGRTLSPPDLQAHLVGSKGVLDELRAEIRGMDAREADLLAQYSDRASKVLRRNLWVDAITSLLVLLTGVAAFALLFGGVVWRVKRLAVNAERLAQGLPLEALPAGRDELGQLAERLQNASLLLATRAAEAQSASHAKTQFLSRTSHELRTPLNAILGFAQILELDLKDSAQATEIGHILAAGRHLLGLIDEVLDIARIEAGELKLETEPLALNALAGEVRELVSPLAAEHSVRVEVDTAMTGMVVRADRKRLRQVLLNLVGNAIKYNRREGRVWIDASPVNGFAHLSVRDEGGGIPVEKLGRLFMPFDRLDADQSAVAGTGLGLAVSRQLALCMGGDIELTSTSARGSTFTLRLPLAAAVVANAEPPPAADAAPFERRAPGQRRVLLIEDNASNVALVQAIVARRPEWTLMVAREGSQGLEFARASAPELILLDLHLPDFRGEDVLRRLRDQSPAQKPTIVIVSADALPETAARLRAAGADEYLTKPLAVPRLLDMLDRIRP